MSNVGKLAPPIIDGRRIIHLKRTEARFLRYCCQDISYWEISDQMGKSPRTIDGYRDDLFLKLGVRSRAGLILWAFKTGFLKPNEIRLNLKSKRRPRQ